MSKVTRNEQKTNLKPAGSNPLRTVFSDLWALDIGYQNVTPPEPDPFKNPPFFLSITTVCPAAAAI